MNKFILIGAVGLIIIVAGWAFFFREQTPQTQEPNDTSSGLMVGSDAIYVADQKPGTSVTANMAVLKNGGYVVIHADNNGAPGAILGASSILSSGQSDNTQISLTRETQENEKLYAMLHTDNGDGTWNPADDAPVKDANGNIIMMAFTISSSSENPDAISL